MDVTASHKDEGCRNPTMKKTDSAIVSKTSFRDGTQSSLCKISFSFGELQNILVEQLYMCVEFLWKSERYELIADVNKPIIAVFEKQRDFKVGFLNPGVSSNILHYTRELLTIFYFLWWHHLHETLCFCFQKLSDLYYDIHRSYLKVAEVVNSEKRLFGRYYRVAFYGQVSFLLI